MSEQEVYDEELAAHNALGQYFVKVGAVVPSTVPPPALKSDGSYATAEEAVKNFNPNHDEKGEFTSGEGEHGAEHALEHIGHELHHAHEVHEVIEAIAGHGHGSVLGVGAHEVVGDAVKLAAKAIASVPGGRAVAEHLTDMHDGARDLADKLTKGLQERYGPATAAAILGSGAIAAAAVRASAGLHGPVGNVIPGQKFIGAIPVVALAEAGRALGLVHPDSKLEKHIGTAAKWVHAVREAIGRPIGKAAEAVKGAGLKAAYAAGKATGAALDAYARKPAVANVDVDAEAAKLVAQMYEGYAEKVKALLAKRAEHEA